MMYWRSKSYQLESHQKRGFLKRLNRGDQAVEVEENQAEHIVGTERGDLPTGVEARREAETIETETNLKKEKRGTLRTEVRVGLVTEADRRGGVGVASQEALQEGEVRLRADIIIIQEG